MLHKLQNVLSKCDACIVYTPLKDEVDYRHNSFPLKIHKKSVVLPNAKDSDPFAWADKCSKELSPTSSYLLIPGTQFDTRGTRHGKGGGWYDRFLSNIPAKWIRVGIAYQSQLSTAPLIREAWDAPVDWLVVRNENSWDVYETLARK